MLLSYAVGAGCPDPRIRQAARIGKLGCRPRGPVSSATRRQASRMPKHGHERTEPSWTCPPVAMPALPAFRAGYEHGWFYRVAVFSPGFWSGRGCWLALLSWTGCCPKCCPERWYQPEGASPRFVPWQPDASAFRLIPKFGLDKALERSCRQGGRTWRRSKRLSS